MFTFGLLSSVFDYITFAVLLIIFEASEGIFQSGWFVLSILTELLTLLVMRTQRPFFKSKPAPILTYTSLVVAILTLAIPYLPISYIMNIEPIPLKIMASLLAIAALYIVVTEIAKYLFYKSKTNQAY